MISFKQLLFSYHVKKCHLLFDIDTKVYSYYNTWQHFANQEKLKKKTYNDNTEKNPTVAFILYIKNV